MTRQDGSGSPTSSGAGPASDGDYTRKLALAILSTLQTRGLLSAEDVDAILIAARRSAHQAMHHASGQTSPAQGRPGSNPAPSAESRDPLPPMQVKAQPSAPQPAVSQRTTAPPEGAPELSPSPEKPGEAQHVAEAPQASPQESGEGPSGVPSPDVSGPDAPGSAEPQPGEKQPPMFDIKLD